MIDNVSLSYGIAIGIVFQMFSSFFISYLFNKFLGDFNDK